MPGTDVSGPTDAMVATTMLESVVFQAVERKEMWHYQKNKKMYMPVISHISEGKSHYYSPVVTIVPNVVELQCHPKSQSTIGSGNPTVSFPCPPRGCKRRTCGCAYLRVQS